MMHHPADRVVHTEMAAHLRLDFTQLLGAEHYPGPALMRLQVVEPGLDLPALPAQNRRLGNRSRSALEHRRQEPIAASPCERSKLCRPRSPSTGVSARLAWAEGGRQPPLRRRARPEGQGSRTACVPGSGAPGSAGRATAAKTAPRRQGPLDLPATRPGQVLDELPLHLAVGGVAEEGQRQYGAGDHWGREQPVPPLHAPGPPPRSTLGRSGSGLGSRQGRLGVERLPA